MGIAVEVNQDILYDAVHPNAGEGAIAPKQKEAIATHVSAIICGQHLRYPSSQSWVHRGLTVVVMSKAAYN